MKSLRLYIQEDLFATPANTIGVRNPNMSSEPNINDGSGDTLHPLCIDINTGKQYRHRKKFRRYKIYLNIS